MVKTIFTAYDMVCGLKDWLKKLGLEMPKTTDDLIKVLEALSKTGIQMEMETVMKFLSFLLVVTETKILNLYLPFGIGDNVMII